MDEAAGVQLADMREGLLDEWLAALQEQNALNNRVHDKWFHRLTKQDCELVK